MCREISTGPGAFVPGPVLILKAIQVLLLCCDSDRLKGIAAIGLLALNR